MEIIARGTLVTAEQNTERQSCAFPGVCVLPSGRWLCGFRAAPTKAGTVGQHAMIAHSDDEGVSWSAPVAPFVPPTVEGKPGLLRAAYLTALGGHRVLAALCWVDHSDPALAFFNEATEGLLDTRIFFAESADEGASWSEPVLRDTTPFHVPTPLTGPVLTLANGAWACQFELNKHYDDTAPWRHASVMMFSEDGGRTWPEHVLTSSDPDNRVFYWDQRPGALSDGRILALFWTYDNRVGVYRDIHAGESLDSGRTWSALWDTGVPGQPAQPVSLPDGRTALVYVDREGEPTIKVRLSEDRGRTWPAHTETTLHGSEVGPQTWRKASMQDAWREMSAFSVGLPATALTRDGDLLVVYYAGPEPDCTNLEWARLRPRRRTVERGSLPARAQACTVDDEAHERAGCPALHYSRRSPHEVHLPNPSRSPCLADRSARQAVPPAEDR